MKEVEDKSPRKRDSDKENDQHEVVEEVRAVGWSGAGLKVRKNEGKKKGRAPGW